MQNKSTAELKEFGEVSLIRMQRLIPKPYLIPRLAYPPAKELAYGPMAAKSAKQLYNLADQMEKGKKFTNHYMASKLLAGTKLIHEFQGDLHEVLVSENGIYQGQSYKSLSAIACKITALDGMDRPSLDCAVIRMPDEQKDTLRHLHT